MSVMLATQNPDAARRVTPRPMPGAGDTVIYHLRPGAMRSGQTAVAAWVLKVDEGNRQLTLLVVYGHDDMMTEDRVPERVGSDYGWEVRPGPDAQIAALRNEFEGLRMANEIRESLVNELRTEIAEMSAGLEAFKLELAQTLFGDHDKPTRSFEDRIQAMANVLEKIVSAGGKKVAK